jgi:hypothetical protein
MNESLTRSEWRCCHMSAQQFDYTATTLEQWRREFREIPQSEHCRDCPAIRSQS